MSDTPDMSQDQFNQILRRLDAIDARMEHSVTKSDVHAAVFQGLAFASAAVVGTLVVLNAVGAFS